MEFRRVLFRSERAEHQSLGHGPRRVNRFIDFGVDRCESCVAHFRTELVADFTSIQPDDSGVIFGEADRIGGGRKLVPIAFFQAGQMARWNPGLGGDILDRQTLGLACFPEALSDCYDVVSFRLVHWFPQPMMPLKLRPLSGADAPL